MKRLELACRCGEVLVEVAGDPMVQLYCHCDDCQAVHGAAYDPEVRCIEAEAVKVVQGSEHLEAEEEPSLHLHRVRGRASSSTSSLSGCAA